MLNGRYREREWAELIPMRRSFRAMSLIVSPTKVNGCDTILRHAHCVLGFSNVFGEALKNGGRKCMRIAPVAGSIL